MNKLKPPFYPLTKTDKFIFTIFIIGFSLFMTFTDDDPFVLKDFIVLILFTINSALIVYFFIFKFLNTYFIDKRIWSVTLKTLVLLSIILICECLEYIIIYTNVAIEEELTLNIVIQFLILHLLTSSILTGFILFKKNIHTQILLLKADNIQKSNELQVLKAQVDPHFLFNNLNTLDALIDTDVKRAKTYIQRLSKLYQYILISKDEDAVPLEEELKFAKDYCYLINERFGDSFQFEFKYDETPIHNKYTPPGAIQILFENIVKHNHGSDQNPILIHVHIKQNTIVVSNYIQSNNNPTPSFGIGLSSLNARYLLLSNKEIVVSVNDRFTVTLPLIKNLNL